MTRVTGITSFEVDRAPALSIGPGCRRRALKTHRGFKVWMIDLDPGSEWPADGTVEGEEALIVSGELIDGEKRLGPGTYIQCPPAGSHRPRTDTGVRLFGFTLLPPGPAAPLRIANWR